MKNTNPVPTKLLWMDLEMTGLDPDKDVILEVAVEVTDFNFKTLESYEARVRGGNRNTVVNRMQANVWWKDYPANRDDFLDKLNEAQPLGVVEDELIELVKKHFGDEPAILAGNSIHNDRKFIARWWPSLDLKLHYRMLDVSALKVLMQGKYGVVFEKQEVHRAFDDIQASIAELEHYLNWLKEQS
ncbi:MAG: oligoribonuclease [Candidatus Saccharibacteria bacterium]|nr:oligoribonuclease [Candidatus Saccharibacteria bacterium]